MFLQENFTSFKRIFLCLNLYCWLSANHAYLVDNNPYRHVETLDPKGKYQLEWVVNWSQKTVTFNVTVETRGYVGFGISKKGKMSGADIVIGGVYRSGKPYFSDRHAIGNFYPVIDENQDWILHSAWESNTHTSISFSRAFDTCDKHDIPITDDVVSVLWAYGENDNSTEYHFGNRGNFSVYLLDPDLTPRVIQSSYRNTYPNKELRDVKVWTINSQFRIPPKRTTYWCNFHKISLPHKHHIIGFNFQINQEAISNMHHLILFRCTAPLNQNPVTIFEPFLRHKGEECYSPGGAVPLGIFPTQYCAEMTYGNAIGGRSLFIPDHVGIPIGENPNEYYLAQIHYDNPTERSDLVSDLQIDIYYTPNLRKHDGSVMSVGHHVPGTPSLILPPSSLNHRFHSHCSSECTAKMFPPEGIKIVTALLHGHAAAVSVRIQHFRNNRELPWIAYDDNYINTFQPSRILRKEVTILPGDQLTIRCIYDTTTANGTVVAGYGTDQEMCQTFMLYYNRLSEYPICRSQIISPEFNFRYLGVRNMTWDQSQLENVATAPPHLAGMTMTEISDNVVNWNLDLRAQLQRDHIIYPQVSICPNLRNPIPTGQPEFVSFPVQVTPYQKSEQCSLV